MPAKKSKTTASEGLLAAQSLQQIANCLAYLVVHTGKLEGKSNRERIPVLASLGFGTDDIATLLSATTGTVAVRLSQVKSQSKPKAKKAGLEEVPASS